MKLKLRRLRFEILNNILPLRSSAWKAEILTTKLSAHNKKYKKLIYKTYLIFLSSSVSLSDLVPLYWDFKKEG